LYILVNIGAVIKVLSLMNHDGSKSAPVAVCLSLLMVLATELTVENYHGCERNLLVLIYRYYQMTHWQSACLFHL
jgi:hypothetical protein